MVVRDKLAYLRSVAEAQKRDKNTGYRNTSGKNEQKVLRSAGRVRLIIQDLGQSSGNTLKQRISRGTSHLSVVSGKRLVILVKSGDAAFRANNLVDSLDERPYSEVEGSLHGGIGASRGDSVYRRVYEHALRHLVEGGSPTSKMSSLRRSANQSTREGTSGRRHALTGNSSKSVRNILHTTTAPGSPLRHRSKYELRSISLEGTKVLPWTTR
ncbi:hypothetical protein KM043_015636 [Ampulex compressa]|nr:hypothetical protein KM043_015636 [Ampulex compressa]